MFKKVLIANRGEIAVRIAQTLAEMDIFSVTVYSEPDRYAPHVACGTQALPLAGESAAETYLDGERIIELAKAHGVDAIHPGYGFLSENEAFARACGAAGITFIGPSAEVIRDMGDKIVARNKIAEVGIPVLGSALMGDDQIADLGRRAESLGFPVIVKAAAGGGGKGMRLVGSADELAAAVQSAQREAAAAFGDGRVFLEKYIARARHVEFQIFGDTQGNAVHLFDRECSIQRRHQKIVEEAPAAALTATLRNKMSVAAVRAAKAIGYVNAGTVEFLVDENEEFYFLEINTRLQVEHPVTEMTLGGLDLVKAQILVAAGNPLPFEQKEVEPCGHAIECRVYAEDAAAGFLPASGVIEEYIPPAGPGIRVDSGVAGGSQVSIHYDPLLAKLIVWAPTRPDALVRMQWALRNFVILGVSTNIEFLQNLMQHPQVQNGQMHTQFLQEHAIAPVVEAEHQDLALLAAALVLCDTTVTPTQRTAEVSEDPWMMAGPWRAG